MYQDWRKQVTLPDAAGNRLTKTALVPGDPDPVAEVSQYSYDDIYQFVGLQNI